MKEKETAQSAGRYAFISYSSKQAQDAEQIRRILEDNEIDCWKDSKSLEPGSHYLASIADAIKACDAFILLLSAESQESVWVPKELELALKHKKHVIPVHIDQSELRGDFELSLAGVHFINAYGRYTDACEDLVRHICKQWGIRYREKSSQATKNSRINRKTGIPYLDTLECQRLTADPENKNRIQHFQCRENPGLAHYLRYRGWEEDSSGAVTYYLIKNNKEEILLYFGLKSGVLFQPLDMDMLKDQYRKAEMAANASRRLNSGMENDQDREVIREFSTYGMQLSEIRNKLYMMQEDEQVTPMHLATRAERVVPSLELSHFCINDTARAGWEETARQLGSGFSMGRVLFWLFVVPTILETQKQIGCQYVYTFVPDSSEDKKLVRYYERSLNFMLQDRLSVVKPLYDFGCPCLYQSIPEMAEERRRFFREMPAARKRSSGSR